MDRPDMTMPTASWYGPTYEQRRFASIPRTNRCRPLPKAGRRDTFAGSSQAPLSGMTTMFIGFGLDQTSRRGDGVTSRRDAPRPLMYPGNRREPDGSRTRREMTDSMTEFEGTAG